MNLRGIGLFLILFLILEPKHERVTLSPNDINGVTEHDSHLALGENREPACCGAE